MTADQLRAWEHAALQGTLPGDQAQRAVIHLVGAVRTSQERLAAQLEALHALNPMELRAAVRDLIQQLREV